MLVAAANPDPVSYCDTSPDRLDRVRVNAGLVTAEGARRYGVVVIEANGNATLDATATEALREELAQQRSELQDLHERNATLQAEVDDLKKGLAAIEARARSELGLIRQDETYFQLLDPKEP